MQGGKGRETSAASFCRNTRDKTANASGGGDMFSAGGASRVRAGRAAQRSRGRTNKSDCHLKRKPQRGFLLVVQVGMRTPLKIFLQLALQQE